MLLRAHSRIAPYLISTLASITSAYPHGTSVNGPSSEYLLARVPIGLSLLCLLMRFVAVTRDRSRWHTMQDAETFFIVARCTRTLSDALVYKECGPFAGRPPIVAAEYHGTFAGTFGVDLGRLMDGWERADGAELLDAFYSSNIVSFNWWFQRRGGGVDCYSLFYPRVEHGQDDVYAHYHFSDITDTPQWYRARDYAFLGMFSRSEWTLRPLDLSDFVPMPSSQ